jgi:hypothetical protein
MIWSSMILYLCRLCICLILINHVGPIKQLLNIIARYHNVLLALTKYSILVQVFPTTIQYFLSIDLV